MKLPKTIDANSFRFMFASVLKKGVVTRRDLQTIHDGGISMSSGLVRASSAERRRRGTQGFASLILGPIALFFALSPAIALASGSSFEIPRPAIEEGLQKGTPLSSLETTDPNAAHELPHEGLGRAEAMQLMHSVFGLELSSSAGIFDELEVEKFLGNNAAVLAPGQRLESEALSAEEERPSHDGYNGPALIESTLPLRTKDVEGQEAAVSLGLERSEGELQPINPLVEVGIPTELGEGITLPSAEVQIQLQGAPRERAPSITEQSVAFYPNVADETDLAVAPTPSGVETLTQLRSPDSSTTQTFHLQVPEGADLESSEVGGAELTQGARTLMTVMPPTAIDADGKSVPATLTVAGNSISVKTKPSSSTAYPVLVDPFFQIYNWDDESSSAGISDWQSYSSAPSYQAVPHWYWSTHPSLDLTSGAGGPAPAWTQAKWWYNVPRWESDYSKYGVRPSTFIIEARLRNFFFWEEGNSAYSPWVEAGIWNNAMNTWAPKNPYYHTGPEGQLLNGEIEYGLPGNTQEAHTALIALTTGEYEAQAKWRHVIIGAATITLGDNEPPKFGAITPPGWIDGTTSPPIGYRVEDSGLGVYGLLLENGIPEGHPGHEFWTTPVNCLGSVSNPCPRALISEEGGPSVKYHPSELPQGVDNLKMYAMDPVGNLSQPATVQLKIDRTAPELSLWGTPYDGAPYEPILEPSFRLTAQAKDGSSTSPQSGVASIEALVDGSLVGSATCATQSCEISREWEWSTEGYSVGEHTLVVKATDRVGHVTTKTRHFFIAHDTMPPTIEDIEEAENPLAAPDGWVEEGVHKFSAVARDGYSGLKKIELHIDGEPVSTEEFPCGLEYSLGPACHVIYAEVDTSKYSPGAHELKLLAEDKRGNQTEQSWTVRIDSSQSLSAQEATETLEAYEETTEGEPIISPLSTEEEEGRGTVPGLEVTGEDIKSTEAYAPSEMTTNPEEGVTIEAPEGSVHFEPMEIESGATPIKVNAEVAGAAANTGKEADSVIRPKFDGVEAFQAIRGPEAPEEYSWTVELGEGVWMVEESPQMAEVYYEDGTAMMAITAEPAHDATGKSVPTSISVTEGDVLTLTVHYKEGGYVYPIVAGASFETGYEAVTIYTPPPQPEPGSPEEEPETVGPLVVSPPLPIPSSGEESEASASFFGYKALKEWAVNICGITCEAWKSHFKGFYFYDFHEAWYTREPKCIPTYVTGQFIEQVFCNWIGGNHQKYGRGYHLTAQDIFTQGVGSAPLLVGKRRHLTVRAFGDGEAFAHDTEDVCNPSRPEC